MPPKLKLDFLQGRDLKPILTGVILVMGILVWSQLYLIPQRSRLMDLRLRNETITKDMALLKQKLVQMPQMEKQLKELTGQYDPRMVTTPPEKQLPEILETIAKAAKTSDVRLIVSKPKMDIEALSPSASGFLELPVQVEASGGYHQIGLFLDALEGSKMLVRIHELKIQASSDDIWHHHATFVLWTYLFPLGDKQKP